MNCQQFTSFIIEAARGQMMDAASRDGATRHAESCQACAVRLAQEQSLTNALRAVALNLKDVSAPARVEAKLLAAFRESLAPRNATAAADAAPLHAPVSLPTAARAARMKPRASRHLTRRVAYAATFAIAASLVLVVLAALYLRLNVNTSPREVVATNSSRAGSKVSPPANELTAATLSPLAPSIRHSVQPSTRPSSAPAIEPAIETVRQPESATPDAVRGGESPRAASKLTRRHTPTIIRAQHVIDGGNAIIEASAGETATATNAAAKSNEPESVTEFISLAADAPATPPLESGQLVRVQVPRAALASLGLPLNAERGNEPVKADVLLGGDGLARAIRFVR